MGKHRRDWAIAGCAIAGGILGALACAAFPARYTASMEFWFAGGRTEVRNSQQLIARAYDAAFQATGIPQAAYPSYDFQKIPISASGSDKERARKLASDAMKAAIEAAGRGHGSDERYASLWLEPVEAPKLLPQRGSTWVGYLRLHSPVPVRLDRTLLAEQMRDAKKLITSKGFLSQVIGSLPRYRLELNSDITAMRRFTIVLRWNLNFEVAPQDDVLRISYTCDNAKDAHEVLLRIVTVLQQTIAETPQLRGNPFTIAARAASLSRDFPQTQADPATRTVLAFTVARPASLPERANPSNLRWIIVVVGCGAGLVLGAALVSDVERQDNRD